MFDMVERTREERKEKVKFIGDGLMKVAPRWRL